MSSAAIFDECPKLRLSKSDPRFCCHDKLLRQFFSVIFQQPLQNRNFIRRPFIFKPQKNHAFVFAPFAENHFSEIFVVRY